MEYKYCKKANYEDYSSGRVLYGSRRIPNFPVRLVNEIFGRALYYSEKKKDLIIYDPCCGGGYLLTVLGLFYCSNIQKIYGSDIDENVLEIAKKNLALLSSKGLDNRKIELIKLYEAFGKKSHQEALDSVERLKTQLVRDIPYEVFVADSTKRIKHMDADIIITDIPYGNLVEWKNETDNASELMLEQLYMISPKSMILAIVMEKKQKIHSKFWIQLEKHSIGKRQFVIMKRI